MGKMSEVYKYSEVEWTGKPRGADSLPLCPKCGGEPKELRRYPVDYTEMYVDYGCEKCGYKFTVNWS
jgi:hypothetical protein